MKVYTSPVLLTEQVYYAQYPNFLYYPRAFSPQECQHIIENASAFPEEQATVTAERIVNDIARKTNVRWMSLTAQTEWIYKKLGYLAELGNQVYQFELAGILEQLQYTHYAGPGYHYGYHMDFGAGSLSCRKLSMVLQLTDPSQYDGGDLQLLNGQTPETVEKNQGALTIFPSFLLHRVTPIIEGSRSSLVVWVNGLTPYR